MSFFYFFLIIGSVVVYLILRFDKQQRRKQKMLLKQTNDVQPLLLMQSLGQKLQRLNEALVQNTAKSEINAQLKKITTDYNCGLINMQVYNSQLNELLKRVEGRC
ncbi:hypothetical protein [Mucilaginibacter lappiensis]|uniref:Uncharacterized membrane-anchored protein YhcB (DUF1043 family) n=1 Tax=Mucilaginibacter lappiensis TaxID=354630 RepID=A0A841JHX0_9SPHI|nr:hypothetical protein [Mucilaginibacter lappiensis]MBB6130537.1 uncharacterized membrane-anchored protein YhcB (DUF1043 family) [Mucilaginibacter lappiensis]